MPKREGRGPNAYRSVDTNVGFHRNAEGSVLYRAGGTAVLVTASIDDSLPKWMADDQGGWLTAEYQMHPRANPSRRENREGRKGPPRGRTMEIQRLVGRTLRSALNLERLGQRSITIDCDVLEADGGTRTASVTAGFMATAMAIYGLGLVGIIRDHVAAISVGYVDGEVRVDLDYAEDSAAQVDMNIVATKEGRIIEVQSTAEGEAIPREVFNEMLDQGLSAIARLCDHQKKVLAAADINLDILMKRMG